MVPPVRWYYILSSWIFVASVLYPFHRISTFPLELLALGGCLEIILNPHKESFIKNLYILFIHLAPFFWIPCELSYVTFGFAFALILSYFTFIYLIGEHPLHIYAVLLNEDHPTAPMFICDRFGLCFS